MIGTVAILIELGDGAAGGKVPVTQLQKFLDTSHLHSKIVFTDLGHSSGAVTVNEPCVDAGRLDLSRSIHPGPSSGLTDPRWHE